MAGLCLQKKEFFLQQKPKENVTAHSTDCPPWPSWFFPGEWANNLWPFKPHFQSICTVLMHGNIRGCSVHRSQQTVFYVHASPNNLPFCGLACALAKNMPDNMHFWFNLHLQIFFLSFAHTPNLRDISFLCSSTCSFCLKKIAVLLKAWGHVKAVSLY